MPDLRIIFALLLLSFQPAMGMQDATSKTVPPARMSPEAGIPAIVDQVIAEHMKDKGTVGIAVGVIRNGKVVCQKTYGMADRENKVPVDADTMFRWASISKPLTAIVAGQLALEGKLDLDADVRTYVPEFPAKDAERPVTMRQLLQHTGGIVHYTNGPLIPFIRQYDTPHPYESVITALDTFKLSPLVSEPGKEFNYSTHGYILASAVVERAGGKPFHELVRERISEPLGLDDLQPDYQWKEIPNRAVGYRRSGGKVITSTDTDVSWKLGGGGFISDLDDLARFAAAINDPDFMTPELRTLLWTPRMTKGDKPARYAMGFGVRRNEEGEWTSVGHSGAQEKTRTIMTVKPNTGSGVVVMTNSEFVDPGEVGRAITRQITP